MATVLHLYKGGDPGLAVATIERQLAAGDRVSVALLHGATLPVLGGAVRIRRVPDELTYDGLLGEIFASDQVVTW